MRCKFILFIISSLASKCCCLYYTETANDTNIAKKCLTDPKCFRCEEIGCMKCQNFIIHPSRECVEECPFGYTVKWSNKIDYMGLMCIHNGNFLGLSSKSLAILTGIIAGIISCLFAFLVAFLYFNYKRKQISQLSDTSSDIDDSPERKDFLKQLETLRPYAQNYLDMLNDTRQQIRQLHQNGDSSAISAYKPVIRDLAKILLLLNQPGIDRLSIPNDWGHLFNWAENTLKRYKRMSDTSQPQVAQLINFLQSPIIPISTLSNDFDHHNNIDEVEFSIRHSRTMSTFKPDQVFGSSISLQNEKNNSEIATNNYNNKTPSINPEWKFEYSLIDGNSSEFNPSTWKNSREFLNGLGGPLFLEDDFYQLGFRPQDEVTTEL